MKPAGVTDAQLTGGGGSYLGELMERRCLQRAAAGRDPFRGLTCTEDNGTDAEDST